MGDVRLMKGNEAVAEAAIRAGADAYFGYPITPQSEILEYLAAKDPQKTTGMVVLQAESEVAAINMVYGAASTGKKAITSSSSPGISLKMEAVSYLAGAELPCVMVNVVRGGPGLGTIQPSQADYFQAVKGGGHGDYKLFVLAPSSVQEMCDHVKLAFEKAFQYRMPAMILTDGIIGQMMEKVELFDPIPRNTDFSQFSDWAICGKKGRERNVITSLELDPERMEDHNRKLHERYQYLEQHEVLYEEFDTDDADYLFVAYGSSARICKKAVELCREGGLKVGLLRPITLFPFPKERLNSLASRMEGMLSVEMSSGQMVEDVQLAVNGKVRVAHFGKRGGIVHTPEDVMNALKQTFIELG